MNQKVIYTCLVGEYDKLIQPQTISDTFDYICFSNDIKSEKVGIWNIRPIPFEHPDKTRLSRYVKLNPQKVLDGYEYSIWIDANIEIVGDVLYKRAEEFINDDILVAQVQHPFYDCIYTDILKCIKFHKDKFQLLVKQYNFLKKEGFPEHYGLFENNLIFRKHGDPLIIEASKMWWNLYNQYAKRDQFSLCYVYWKLNIKPNLFLPLGESTRNNPNFHYYEHSIKLNFQNKIKFQFMYWKNQIILFLFKEKLFLK